MKILFWLYMSRINKKSEVPIMLRITINKARINIATGISVKPEQWDHSKGHIKGNSPFAKETNRTLRSLYSKPGRAYNDLMEQNDIITVEMIRNRLKESTASKSLFFVFDLYRQKMDKLIRVGKASLLTVQKCNTCERKLKKFIYEYYQKKDIMLFEITIQFIDQFHEYLATVENLTHNVVLKQMQQLKHIINIARRYGLKKIPSWIIL